MSRILFASTFSLVLCFTAASAFAASDEDLAAKCVPGMKYTSGTGVEMIFLANGTLNGSGHAHGQLMAVRGNWQVKNGLLNFQTQSESGNKGKGAMHLRMDAAGKCYRMTPDGEKPFER